MRVRADEGELLPSRRDEDKLHLREDAVLVEVRNEARVPAGRNAVRDCLQVVDRDRQRVCQRQKEDIDPAVPEVCPADCYSTRADRRLRSSSDGQAAKSTSRREIATRASPAACEATPAVEASKRVQR